MEDYQNEVLRITPIVAVVKTFSPSDFPVRYEEAQRKVQRLTAELRDAKYFVAAIIGEAKNRGIALPQSEGARR